MNNTAIISTLSAIVVAVVVLIFTEGSLAAAAAAAATSSFTPQLQNLTCTHTGNSAACSQGGIMSTTTIQIPLPMPQEPQPPAALAITRHVIDDIVATISAKDFSIGASGTNVWPQRSFQGTQYPGTNIAVTSKPGTSSAALLQQAKATTITADATTTNTAVADHDKCSSSGSGGGGDIMTCMHDKDTHYPAKDTTTPFVLPIPFP
jgi:hypothetical protein